MKNLSIQAASSHSNFNAVTDIGAELSVTSIFLIKFEGEIVGVLQILKKGLKNSEYQANIESVRDGFVEGVLEGLSSLIVRL